MLPRFVVTGAVSAAVIAALFLARPPSADITVLCSNNRNSCEAVVEAFEDTSGLNVELLRVPTSEALGRLSDSASEFDVWMGGPSDAYVIADQRGLLQVTFGGDEGASWQEIYGGILALCVHDSHAGISSWADLLDGNVSVAAPNPLTSGTAATMLAVQHVLHDSLEDSTAYFDQLDEHVSVYTDSGVVPATLVARERVDVGITFAPYCERERELGAPVHTVYPEEGTGYEIGAIALIDGTPHLDAASQFVDFAVSDEGQKLGADAASQAPISPTLDGNLGFELAHLEVPVVHLEAAKVAAVRSELISRWLEQVRDGQI